MAGRQPAKQVSAFAGLRFGLAHEVSILITLIGAVGRCPGVAPRSKISMMIMRPPQHGQGCERVGVSLPSLSSAAASQCSLDGVAAVRKRSPLTKARAWSNGRRKTLATLRACVSSAVIGLRSHGAFGRFSCRALPSWLPLSGCLILNTRTATVWYPRLSSLAISPVPSPCLASA